MLRPGPYMSKCHNVDYLDISGYNDFSISFRIICVNIHDIVLHCSPLGYLFPFTINQGGYFYALMGRITPSIFPLSLSPIFLLYPLSNLLLRLSPSSAPLPSSLRSPSCPFPISAFPFLLPSPSYTSFTSSPSLPP